MKRPLLVLTILTTMAAAGCGDNQHPLLDYTNPPSGGALRLVKSTVKPTSENEVVLDLVVGDQPLTGYSVGFNLPLGHGVARLTSFVPGTALDPGTSPPAAQAALPSSGPLADHLVTGLSQKAAGPGAVTTNTTVQPGAVLYTVHLEVLGGAPDGVVVDGAAADFQLPSGGMRDRSGTTVVLAKDVAIGKLEINR